MNWNLIKRNARKVLDQLDIPELLRNGKWSDTIAIYNYSHSKNARISIQSGIARTTLIIPSKKYVIKILRNSSRDVYNSQNEEIAYTRAVEMGVERYFVKTYHFEYYGYYVQVMEKIRLASSIKETRYYCLMDEHLIPPEDEKAVASLFQDDHNCNWGFDKDGNVKIFDYTI